MHTVNVATALVTLLIFAFLAVRRFRAITSPRDFFHNERLTSNIVSLTVANITLGSGVAYLVSGGYQHGYLLYLSTLAVAAGYLLLAELMHRCASPEVLGAGNFLAGVDQIITERTARRSWFGPAAAWSLVVAYLLFIGFEVYASSNLIAPLFVGHPVSSDVMGIAVIIFAVTLLYTLTGGILGVFRTDKLQLTAVVFLILGLLVAVLAPSTSTPVSTAPVPRPIGWATVIAVVNATIAALATQFYNLLNWASLSHVAANRQRNLLRSVGLLTTVLLALILTVGVLLPEPPGETSPVEYVFIRFNELARATGALGVGLSIILVAGALSVLVSTVDSLLIAIVMFVYDSIEGRTSRASDHQLGELGRIRLLAATCLLLAFLLMVLFQTLRPNIFYLLLSIAGVMVVFAPMLATAAYLSRRPTQLVVFTPPIVGVYLILFLCSFVANAVAISTEATLTPWIGTGAFTVSAIWSGAVLVLAVRRRELEHH